jgi:NAD(P)-dependent dehydrogenase (short-subunit alcohol dehydrogenase family)
MSDKAPILLTGHRVVVTGGSRGLGAAFVNDLCLAGARVVFGDVLHEEGEAVMKKMRDAGHDATFLPLDLMSESSINEFVKKAADLMGGIDGLVNNAAITDSGGKLANELTCDTWDAVQNVNVRGTWLMCNAALPWLKQAKHGAVVNLASDTALWGAPKLLAYVASKGAVIAMTHTLAREYGEYEVTVNAIAPGLTEVEATAYVPKERHGFYRDGRALKRNQVPQDVTGPVLFLLSESARFVTGQVLPVNGGFVMQ